MNIKKIKKFSLVIGIIFINIISISLVLVYLEKPVEVWEIEHQDPSTNYQKGSFLNYSGVIRLEITNEASLGDYISISKKVNRWNKFLEFLLYVNFSNSILNPIINFHNCYIYLNEGKPHFRSINDTFHQIYNKDISGYWVNCKFTWDFTHFNAFIDDCYSGTFQLATPGVLSLTISLTSTAALKNSYILIKEIL